MAVQAHFPNDYTKRIQNLDEPENHQLHGIMNHLLLNKYKIKDCLSNPQSELTANGRGLKKRSREESLAMDLTTTPIHFGGFDSNMIGAVVNPSICMDQMRFEIDTVIRLQNERLRLGFEQAQKRHCRSLISLFEQQLVKNLREKEADLENAIRKNAELEAKARQMNSENQIWCNLATNNEAIVANLKASLEQALLHNAAVNNNAGQAKEGYGDSDGTAFPADDAQSCCIVGEGGEERTNGAVRNVTAKEGRRAVPNSISCKVCREKEVGVLLLPCRHLCLCVDCESKNDTCPLCHVGKNGSLQIFLS